MTTKEYCNATPPVASCNVFINEYILLHGIDYGVDDAAYISSIFGTLTTYHRLKIHYAADGVPYIVFKDVRLYFDQFVKLSDDFVIPYKDKSINK